MGKANLEEMVYIKLGYKIELMRDSATLSVLIKAINENMIQDFDDVKKYLGIEVKDADS